MDAYIGYIPEELLAFCDSPTGHWVHLRTKVTKRPGPRAAGPAMAFTLIGSAQARWRSVNAPYLVALVRAGAVFRGGVLAERREPAVA